MEKGGGEGVWEVEGGRWRMETGEKMGEESNRSHVAGSGEAEDVGVCRPPGKLVKGKQSTGALEYSPRP
jgi:hypothetical protein